MPQLALNGVDLSPYLEIGSFQRSSRVIGERRRAFDGTYRRDVLDEKQVWEAKTIPVTQEVGLALRGLIEGRGDAFTFDADLWSARGVEGVGAGILDSGFHGTSLAASFLAVTADLSDIIGATWSVFGLHYDIDGDPAWRHQILRSDAVEWTDGALGSYSSVVTVSGGSVTFNGSLLNYLFDDYCVVPYLVPASWVASLYAEHQARSIASNLLKPRATGDLLPSTRNVRGTVTGSSFVAGMSGGVWTQNLERLSFILEDV